jgi:4-aminobutyrate aminotransferase
VAAIEAQLDALPFCPPRYINREAIDLARRLVELAPGALGKVLLAPSGSAAISMALKLARYATGCHKTVPIPLAKSAAMPRARRSARYA